MSAELPRYILYIKSVHHIIYVVCCTKKNVTVITYIYIYRNNNRSLVPFMIYGSTLQQNAANNS